MNGDPNMTTLLQWASEYQITISLPTELENDSQKQIEIVDIVESCVGKEFEKDKAKFKLQYGREPTSLEASKNIVPFALYDPVRKQGFLGCIKQCIQNKLPGIEEKYQLNFALKLWSGCLATAKTIALGTQTGKNTAQFRSEMIPRIDTVSTKDMIYRKGEEIACIWKPDPKDISFDGIPTNSNARKYESEWFKRQGTRSTKQCT
jgi:hypothetical protein